MCAGLYMNKQPSVWVCYFFVLGIFVVMVRVFVIGVEPGVHIFDRNLIDQIIFIWGLISCLALWFWMLADFFKYGVGTQKVTWWGFSLMLGVYAAATLYFFFVYIPRTKKMRADSSE
jgi:hypothetical protein